MIEDNARVIVGLVLFCLIMRFMYYYLKLRTVKQHRVAFVRFLEATQEKPTNYQPYAELAEKWKEITKLLRQADIDLVLLQRTPSGSMMRTTSILVFKDLSNVERLQALDSINQALGHFAARSKETFSLVFWIESLINWPKSLLGFLGFEKEGAFAKLLQILFLVVEIVGAIILVVRNYTSL